MPRAFLIAFSIACVASALLTGVGVADARTWSDDTGKYHLGANLVAFDDHRAILKRDADGQLGVIEIDRLSEEDREYLASTSDATADSDTQVWKLREGLELPGRVVDYTRREVTLERRRGKIYVNDRRFENLPAVYQKIVPLVVGEALDNSVRDESSLKNWLVHLKGEPQTFSVDGVVLELGDGDEYTLPFFLFSADDLDLLRSGWKSWLEANGEVDRDRHTLELRSLASEQDEPRNPSVAERQLRVAQLQLGLAAVDTGLTSLWEVTLYPPPGSGLAPQWVVAPGRDSRAAQQAALAQRPGYTLGPVRKVSR